MVYLERGRKMMIQVISYNQYKSAGDFVYSKLSAPRSLDEFDINIIDIADSNIWKYNEMRCNSINCIKDFRILKQMIQNSSTAKTIIALPQDISISYYYYSNSYHGTARIKDILKIVNNDILSELIPDDYSPIVYENTTTTLDEMPYFAAFFFDDSYGNERITTSDKSNKTTTVKLSKRLFITTLSISSNPQSQGLVTNFLNCIFPREKQSKPAWVDEYTFDDDLEQRSIIDRNRQVISDAENSIRLANAKLDKNDRIKSILYTNGDELVSVVFEILEKILNYDLSEYKDKKEADFIIKKPKYTLIGEIKGVSSNVKYENISQVERHQKKYLDHLEQEGLTENLRQLLIINPFRDKPLTKREPIHQNQIHLAEQYGSLIIETKTFLKMFELFLQGQLTETDCERLLTTKTGLLKEEELMSIPDQDMSPFKV